MLSAHLTGRGAIGGGLRRVLRDRVVAQLRVGLADRAARQPRERHRERNAERAIQHRRVASAAKKAQLEREFEAESCSLEEDLRAEIDRRCLQTAIGFVGHVQQIRIVDSGLRHQTD